MNFLGINQVSAINFCIRNHFLNIFSDLPILWTARIIPEKGRGKPIKFQQTQTAHA